MAKPPGPVVLIEPLSSNTTLLIKSKSGTCRKEVEIPADNRRRRRGLRPYI